MMIDKIKNNFDGYVNQEIDKVVYIFDHQDWLLLNSHLRTEKIEVKKLFRPQSLIALFKSIILFGLVALLFATLISSSNSSEVVSNKRVMVAGAYDDTCKAAPGAPIHVCQTKSIDQPVDLQINISRPLKEVVKLIPITPIKELTIRNTEILNIRGVILESKGDDYNKIKSNDENKHLIW